jgi:hypothetical protein
MSSANLDGADLAAVVLGGLINEDVMQQIFDISDIPLPFTDMIGSGSHDNSFTEWTMDRLAVPDLTNAVVDGADAGADASSTGIRVANHSQISEKTLRVSTRAQDSSTIGFANSLAYQVMMRGNEARRDVEAIMLSVQASVADDGALVPGKSAGLGAWIVGTDIFGDATGSAVRGALGADGGWLDTETDGLVAIPTAGTTVALALSDIQNVLQSVWELGGDPTVLMARPIVIRNLSTFMFTSSAQIATLQRDKGEDGAAQAQMSVNIMITDFGVTVKMIPNRLQQVAFTDNDNLYIITPSQAMLSFLTGWQTAPLARTGTADNRQVSADWTLKVLNWEAFGVVADIDAATPVLAVPA